MEALRDMAERLMVARAVAAAEPMLPPATGSRNRSLSKAELDGFCRVVVENYFRQKRVAPVAGVGLAAAAVALAGFGVHRLNTSNGRDD